MELLNLRNDTVIPTSLTPLADTSSICSLSQKNQRCLASFFRPQYSFEFWKFQLSYLSHTVYYYVLLNSYLLWYHCIDMVSSGSDIQVKKFQMFQELMQLSDTIDSSHPCCLDLYRQSIPNQGYRPQNVQANQRKYFLNIFPWKRETLKQSIRNTAIFILSGIQIHLR